MAKKVKNKTKEKNGLIINLFPQYFTAKESEIDFLTKKLELNSIALLSTDKIDNDIAGNFDVIISYNSTVLFHAETLKNMPHAIELQKLVDSASEKYIYQADKHIVGLELLPDGKYDEIIRPEKKRVLIAVPCYKYAEWQCVKSVYDLIVPDNVETELLFMPGYTVVQARNNIVEASIANGFDYTFFVDSDVVMPSHTLVALLNTDKDITTGWYIKKIQGQRITELYGPDKLGLRPMVNILEPEIPQGIVFPVQGCGFGCTLVKNEVFKNVGKSNWFEYLEKPDGQTCSEDVAFCIKASHTGASIVADAGLRCGHVGNVVF